MDQVADSIANAEREAANGDFRKMASLFAYVTLRLWMRSKLLERKLEALEGEVQRQRPTW